MASHSLAGGCLYFAYGSNLWIDQMAKRCPRSSFKGRGTLEGYRWQINQRGVANVVQAPGHSVQGLVFSVTPTDERTLDRNEGISKKFYERQFLTITLEEHPLLANQKTSQVAQWLKNTRDDKDKIYSLDSSFGERRPALVYVSNRYKDEGEIRAEYIKRMQCAATDAIFLGVSQSWVEGVMGPYINPAKTESPTPTAQVQAPNSPSQRLEQAGAAHATSSAPALGRDAIPSDAGRPPRPASASHHHLLTLTQDTDTVSLQVLRESNRQIGPDSGVAFPWAMVDGVKLSNLYAAQQDEGEEKVYLVFTASRGRQSNTGGDCDVVKVQWSTRNLELANELAMSHFRSLWSDICPDSLAEGYGQWSRVPKNKQPGTGGLSWDLNDGVCLSLSGSVGETSNAAVWVEPQTLIKCA